MQVHRWSCTSLQVPMTKPTGFLERSLQWPRIRKEIRNSWKLARSAGAERVAIRSSITATACRDQIGFLREARTNVVLDYRSVFVAQAQSPSTGEQRMCTSI